MDFRAALFSQAELSIASDVPRGTVDSWLHRGVLKPTRSGPRSRGTPKFSLVTIVGAKLIWRMVKELKIPPSTAADITATVLKNDDWIFTTVRSVDRGHEFQCFAIVFWSDRSEGWDAWIQTADGDRLAIEFKAMSKARAEPELARLPLAVLPVQADCASVYKRCIRILKGGNA